MAFINDGSGVAGRSVTGFGGLEDLLFSQLSDLNTERLKANQRRKNFVGTASGQRALPDPFQTQQQFNQSSQQLQQTLMKMLGLRANLLGGRAISSGFARGLG